LSHIHPDHSGGYGYIVKNFCPGEIWDNGLIEYEQDTGVALKHLVLGRGDIIETGIYRITALHPYKRFYTISGNENEGENNSSLVLKISGGKSSFLFPGDIEDEAEADMSQLGQWLSSDVMKVPHHGSKRSLNKEFISEVSPSIAVISVGRDNSFGHPSPETLKKLAGIKVFRTDIDGAVKITETENGPVTRTYRDFEFQKGGSLDREIGNIRKLFLKW